MVASADAADEYPTMLGFTHAVVREASVNTIYSGSRLWLPVAASVRTINVATDHETAVSWTNEGAPIAAGAPIRALG